MRIMQIVCGPGAGGAEVFVKDMAKAMIKEGHHVHLVFLQTASESGRAESFSRSFLADLESNGILFSFIGARARENPLFGILKLRKIIKESNPDVIHAHLYHVLFLLWFIPTVPVVFTKHSIQVGMPDLFFKLFMMRPSRFVAICAACLDKFGGLLPRKVVKIDNGVDPARVEPKARSSPSIVNIAFLGRLSQEKNISLLLQACKVLKNRNFFLKVAGEGPELSNLKKLSLDLEIENKVSFVGNIENTKDFLNESDIFVMCSLSEGLPISLIEASMSGLPCVVSDVGGCSEVVHVCQNGLVTPPNDLEALRDALDHLIADHELRSQFSKSALVYSKHYSIGRAAKQHIDLYRELK